MFDGWQQGPNQNWSIHKVQWQEGRTPTGSIGNYLSS